ncbi:hypothetical protein QUF55_04445 [Clostridiaceae bacterium HSG29]|nr:hypothetical protein [Clostridiaceae bacterium HSG29]
MCIMKKINEIRNIVLQKLKKIIKSIIRYFTSLYWCIRNLKSFSSYLRKNHDIKVIKPIKKDKWHLGHKYFYGLDSNNVKLFIKTGGTHRLISNEVRAISKVNEINPIDKITPNIIAFNNEYKEDYMILEYINTKKLSEIDFDNLTITERKDVIKKLLLISQIFWNGNISHRDIRPENIFITYNKKNEMELLIFDFSFSVTDGLFKSDGNIPSKIYNTLGGKYKPDFNIWDDNYSLYMICKELDSNFKKNFCDGWKILNYRMKNNILKKLGRY